MAMGMNSCLMIVEGISLHHISIVQRIISPFFHRHSYSCSSTGICLGERLHRPAQAIQKKLLCNSFRCSSAGWISFSSEKDTKIFRSFPPHVLISVSVRSSFLKNVGGRDNKRQLKDNKIYLKIVHRTIMRKVRHDLPIERISIFTFQDTNTLEEKSSVFSSLWKLELSSVALDDDFIRNLFKGLPFTGRFQSEGMAFTAAHLSSSPDSLSSTWCGIICKHCNRSGPSFSHRSRETQTAGGVRSSRARSYYGRISIEWWPKTAATVVGGCGTPPGRSSRWMVRQISPIFWPRYNKTAAAYAGRTIG
ncbi:hypothetical protein M9H77_11027 [Catharanthus roseus]|uniref:Uncharacterized protein n=1 Tax=Catharanthus roseus TaxID=4058 RepID=A0ACC0BDF8_CATRO|nr:hypothetical protein M9H77_11027 [Catharanthus roseus]